MLFPQAPKEQDSDQTRRNSFQELRVALEPWDTSSHFNDTRKHDENNSASESEWEPLDQWAARHDAADDVSR